MTESSAEEGSASTAVAEAVAGVIDNHVVLGAESPLGKSLVDHLVAESRNVRAVSFGPGSQAAPQGSESVSADPFQTGSIAESCRGASKIYDCFLPDFGSWKKTLPEVTGNVLLAAIEVGATAVFSIHVVSTVVDNIHLEREIINAHGSGLTRTVFARFPQLFGPGVDNPLYRLVYDAALQGKKAHWIGDLDVQRSFLDVNDAAKAMVLLAETPSTHGRGWSVASPTPLTGREFIELTFKAAGKEPKVGKWGRGIILTGSLLATDTRELLEMPYDYYSSLVLDGSEFTEALPGFSYTAADRTMAAALAWYKGQSTSSRAG
jgi:NAD dependent epimerase/dehydratase family